MLRVRIKTKNFKFSKKILGGSYPSDKNPQLKINNYNMNPDCGDFDSFSQSCRLS